MPWHRTVFLPDPGVNVARQLQVVFDNMSIRDTGRQTFHGLELYEQAGEDITILVETPEFTQALDASEAIIEQIAESLVNGTFNVDEVYMQQILTMQGIDGSFELRGSDRDSVMRVLNTTRPTQSDIQVALHVAKQAADAIVWARLRNLTDGEAVEIARSIPEAVHAGITSVEIHRQQGTSEYGCPGDGPSNTRQNSIFDMSSEQLASTFMRKIFTTNCPLCQEKNVTATQESGTITCGTCKGCVDVCTGEVIQKSRKRAKVKESVGKLTAQSVGILDWIFGQWAKSNNKRRLVLQKQQSMRR